jgi:ABC-type uncharacterized transport system permease subunit
VDKHLADTIIRISGMTHKHWGTYATEQLKHFKFLMFREMFPCLLTLEKIVDMVRTPPGKP